MDEPVFDSRADGALGVRVIRYNEIPSRFVVDGESLGKVSDSQRTMAVRPVSSVRDGGNA